MSYSFREYLVGKDKNKFYSSPFPRWFYLLVPILWFSKDGSIFNFLVSEIVFLAFLFVLYLINRRGQKNEKPN